MRRLQVYLTEEQSKLVANRAADSGLPKAEVIRRILDRGLGLNSGAGCQLPEAGTFVAWSGATKNDPGQLSAR